MTLNDVPNRAVCPKCNSGVLSQLDKELCSRSYLSVIASREIGAHLWQAWDVDHESHNLLVDARPAWAADESLNSLVCYPQITFERSGPVARGDSEEFRRFGQEDAAKVLFQAVRQEMERRGATGRFGIMADVPAGVAWYGQTRAWSQPQSLRRRAPRLPQKRLHKPVSSLRLSKRRCRRLYRRKNFITKSRLCLPAMDAT